MRSRQKFGRVLAFPTSEHRQSLGARAVFECLECGGPRDVEQSMQYVHKPDCPVLIAEQNARRQEARRAAFGWIAGT